MLNRVLKYIQVDIVDNAGTPSYFINPEKKYLIIAGYKGDGTMQLNAPNVLPVTTSESNKYLDTLSAESDFFTRLQTFQMVNLDYSTLRSGKCEVVELAQVLIMEFNEPEKHK